ncbi:MAG: ABC transporter substrate-binding protein [Deltaproteobacteria bacterium]|nr:ABC transporter substrate-binding protein [Deltaproteobacteria bacterium]
MNSKITIWSATLLLLATVSLAQAQLPEQIRRIGFLSTFSASHSGSTRWHEAFRQGLHEHGWVVGKNISIENRWVAGKRERIPELAAELLGLDVEVIVVHGGRPARVVQRMNKEIPIVMAEASDAVGRGIVKSLARPGGNITGLTSINVELFAKRLELLKAIVPTLSRVAVIWTPKSPASKHAWIETQLPARQLGLELHSMELRRSDELEKAFEDAARCGVGALVGTPGVLSTFNQKRISDLAVRSRLPTIYSGSDWVTDAGGLMSYATNYEDLYRRAATYVDKILNGANPADLPVEQPIAFELVINPKTAKQIGLTIPPNVLARANEVIR